MASLFTKQHWVFPKIFVLFFVVCIWFLPGAEGAQCDCKDPFRLGAQACKKGGDKQARAWDWEAEAIQTGCDCRPAFKRGWDICVGSPETQEVQSFNWEGAMRTATNVLYFAGAALSFYHAFQQGRPAPQVQQQQHPQIQAPPVAQQPQSDAEWDWVKDIIGIGVEALLA